MLALVAILTIAVMLTLIMTKKMQTLIALILVPIVGCLIAGYSGLIVLEDGAAFTLGTLGSYMTDGIKNIAPTGVMFIFAILFFGILTDAGTFEPIIEKVLKVVGTNPVKICVGTVVLTCLVHLDGSGAVTFLIVIPAMLPLYKKLGMRVTTLATLTALGAGVMNMLPWGGPTLRAITALESSVEEIFIPMVPSLIAGIIFVFVVAVFLGRKEAVLIGSNGENVVLDDIANEEKDSSITDLYRPKLFAFNIILILITIYILIRSILPPASIFMISTAIALMVNYPKISEQKARVDAHAKESLMMASMLFAAGSFIGIMNGSGMLIAMSDGLVSIIPESLGNAIPVIVGVLAMPLSLIFDPDSYYYGIMPVLANAVDQMGGDGVMVARASIIGQMTTGFPVSPLTGSTFLLTGLVGLELGEHQRKTIPLAFLATIVMLIVALIVGAITF